MTVKSGSRKYRTSLPPTEGIGNPKEERWSQRPEKCMKLQWNFQKGGDHKGGGGGGGEGREYGYFLELNNITKLN